MLNDVELVETFFDAIYRLDFDAALPRLPVPTVPAVGKDAIRRKLDLS